MVRQTIWSLAILNGLCPRIKEELPWRMEFQWFHLILLLSASSLASFLIHSLSFCQKHLSHRTSVQERLLVSCKEISDRSRKGPGPTFLVKNWGPNAKNVLTRYSFNPGPHLFIHAPPCIQYRVQNSSRLFDHTCQWLFTEEIENVMLWSANWNQSRCISYQTIKQPRNILKWVERVEKGLEIWSVLQKLKW